MSPKRKEKKKNCCYVDNKSLRQHLQKKEVDDARHVKKEVLNLLFEKKRMNETFDLDSN